MTVITWVGGGGASVAVEGRSLEGVDHVAVGDGCQVVFVWKGALKTRRVQLREDDLRREKPAPRHHPVSLDASKAISQHPYLLF